MRFKTYKPRVCPAKGTYGRRLLPRFIGRWQLHATKGWRKVSPST